MRDAKSIEPFFAPSSVAVIGASGKRGSIGYTIFQNMLKAGKKVFPVNPRHRIIQGRKAYASVMDIGERVELAVIAVPAETVPCVLEECMKCRVRASIIVSAGFSETGDKRLTQRIEALIRKYPKTRVMGPNCVGVVDTSTGTDTTFFVRSRMKPPKKGSLAFISQSGALGSMILDWAATQEFGISKFASYGNAIDVDEADLLQFLATDPQTKVITAYLEGAKHGRKFYRIAKEVSRKKPIVALKGGKNEETRKATVSHTGSLAGSEEVYGAVFRQAGIIEADDLLDLFSIAKILQEEPLPHGSRVQVITNGGGFGIVMADQLVENGLALAKLSGNTTRKLKREMPSATVSNPLDLLGDADAERYRLAIEACLSDRNVDIVVVLALFNLPTLEAKRLSILKRARKRAKKPVIVISIGSDYTQKYLEMIEKAGFTTFNYPGTAAKAVKGIVTYAKHLRVAMAL